MLIILGLILISLIVIVGGDRGVVSLIALVGNLLLLSFAIWLMAAGVPVLFVTVGAGIVISMHYIILSKWNECKDLERIYFCGYYNAGFIFCHLCCNMEY